MRPPIVPLHLGCDLTKKSNLLPIPNGILTRTTLLLQHATMLYFLMGDTIQDVIDHTTCIKTMKWIMEEVAFKKRSKQSMKQIIIMEEANVIPNPLPQTWSQNVGLTINVVETPTVI